MESKNQVKAVPSSTSLNKKIKSTIFQDQTKFENDEPNDAGSLNETFNFIDYFSILLGWKLSYDWTWKNNPRHWIATAFLVFSWTQFFYSQIKYFANGEYKRIFEVFALYGGAISVIETK